ncbi:hypothetical protein A4R35_08765 [Thermogemmatispora tikiterensis]|uniref:Uncharacterized protein n=1 Tax=Thermogemmatispora tikiterensis TaxID=1825093 RepID=A0A328VIZ8_9CHLR|nr:hypothetical protein A4R35_08765 [Thermogemmatispora tikiterensis]
MTRESADAEARTQKQTLAVILAGETASQIEGKDASEIWWDLSPAGTSLKVYRSCGAEIKRPHPDCPGIVEEQSAEVFT